MFVIEVGSSIGIRTGYVSRGRHHWGITPDAAKARKFATRADAECFLATIPSRLRLAVVPVPGDVEDAAAVRANMMPRIAQATA